MPDLMKRSRPAALVERLLRIPPEPEPPAGTHSSLQVFRGAPGYYKLLLVRWLAKQLATGVGLAFGLSFIAMIPNFPGRIVLDVVEYFGVLTYLVMIPITYLMVHLDYQLRWYIVTDRSLRIREGLVSVDEKTMSFANIQNISVRQGPLQRVFGIADVEVRSAGGGSRSSGETKHVDLHLGYFRGVDNAEEIRDAILDRVRHLRDSGLGDPDHHEPHLAPAQSDALDAARELLDEARALRSVA